MLRAIAGLLEQRFGITRTTVQVEVEGCDPNDMYCTLRPAEQGHAGHDHGGQGQIARE